MTYTDEELLDALRGFADEHGRPPTWPEANGREGFPGPDTFVRHFGSWNAAVAEAGFEPRNRRRSDEELLADLREFVERYGEQPTTRAIRAHEDMASPPTYRALRIMESGARCCRSGAVHTRAEPRGRRGTRIATMTDGPLPAHVAEYVADDNHDATPDEVIAECDLDESRRVQVEHYLADTRYTSSQPRAALRGRGGREQPYSAPRKGCLNRLLLRFGAFAAAKRGF